MNWTGGALERSRESSKSLLTIQKRHFAKAREKKRWGQVKPPDIRWFGDTLTPGTSLYPNAPRDAWSTSQGLVSGFSAKKRLNKSTASLTTRSLQHETSCEASDRSASIFFKPNLHSSLREAPRNVATPRTAPKVEERNLERLTLIKQKENLLRVHDWVGISHTKPTKICFTDVEDREQIGKRRRLRREPLKESIFFRSPSRKAGNDRMMRFSPRHTSKALHDDNISVRIGSAVDRSPRPLGYQSHSSAMKYTSSISDDMLDEIYPEPPNTYAQAKTMHKAQSHQSAGSTRDSTKGLLSQNSLLPKSVYTEKTTDFDGALTRYVIERQSSSLAKHEWSFPLPNSHKHNLTALLSRYSNSSRPRSRGWRQSHAAQRDDHKCSPHSEIALPPMPVDNNLPMKCKRTTEKTISGKVPLVHPSPLRYPISQRLDEFVHEHWESQQDCQGQCPFQERPSGSDQPELNELGDSGDDPNRTLEATREYQSQVRFEKDHTAHPSSIVDKSFENRKKVVGIHSAETPSTSSLCWEGSNQGHKTTDLTPTKDAEVLWREFVLGCKGSSSDWVSQSEGCDPKTLEDPCFIPQTQLPLTQPSMEIDGTTNQVKPNPHLSEETRVSMSPEPLLNILKDAADSPSTRLPLAFNTDDMVLVNGQTQPPSSSSWSGFPTEEFLDIEQHAGQSSSFNLLPSSSSYAFPSAAIEAKSSQNLEDPSQSSLTNLDSSISATAAASTTSSPARVHELPAHPATVSSHEEGATSSDLPQQIPSPATRLKEQHATKKKETAARAIAAPTLTQKPIVIFRKPSEYRSASMRQQQQKQRQQASGVEREVIYIGGDVGKRYGGGRRDEGRSSGDWESVDEEGEGEAANATDEIEDF